MFTFFLVASTLLHITASQSNQEITGYSFHSEYACSGRNELGITRDGTLVECADRCNAIAACVSFEYASRHRFERRPLCQLSTSCTLDLADSGDSDGFDLWVKQQCAVDDDCADTHWCRGTDIMVCTEYVGEGGSCGSNGIVNPDYHERCEEGLECVFPENLVGASGTCTRTGDDYVECPGFSFADNTQCDCDGDCSENPAWCGCEAAQAESCCDGMTVVDCVMDESATRATCTDTCGTVPAVALIESSNGGAACNDYTCLPGDGTCPQVGLEDCEWTPRLEVVSIMSQMLIPMPYFGFTCPADTIMTGFKLYDSGYNTHSFVGNPLQVKCCDMFGHSAVTVNSDLSGTYDVTDDYVQCDASEHQAFCGVYDHQVKLVLAENDYMKTSARKCCEIECTANYCANGDWGIDDSSCQVIRAEYTGGEGFVDLVCPEGMIMTKVIDKPTEDDAAFVNYIHEIECCPLDIVPPPTKAPSPSPTTDPTPSPTISPTTDPSPSPTNPPTTNPSPSPTKSPTTDPSPSPTKSPTTDPSPSPTNPPTTNPSPSPTKSPTTDPSPSPTNPPTTDPSPSPTTPPSPNPTTPPSPNPTTPPSPSPTTPPTPPPSYRVRKCIMKIQQCTLETGEFIRRVEDCMQNDIRNTCILLTTGSDINNSGHLRLKVEGEIVFDDKFFIQGETFARCYDGFVPDFKLQGPSNDAWVGRIQISYNDIPHSLSCSDCYSGDGPVGTWVFDGDVDSYYLGETTCLNGKECSISANTITEETSSVTWYRGRKEVTMNNYDGCGVPAEDGLTIGATYSVTGIEVNGGCGSSAVFMQSTPVELKIQYLNEEETCTGCVEQFYVGIKGGELNCVESVMPTSTQTKTTTLDLSGLAVGTYEVIAAATWEYDCVPMTEGTPIFTLEVTADGLGTGELFTPIPEASLGLAGLDVEAASDLPFAYALQSAPYQLTVHGLALLGTFAVAVQAFTLLRPKQDYATILEHEI